MNAVNLICELAPEITPILVQLNYPSPLDRFRSQGSNTCSPVGGGGCGGLVDSQTRSLIPVT